MVASKLYNAGQSPFTSCLFLGTGVEDEVDSIKRVRPEGCTSLGQGDSRNVALEILSKLEKCGTHDSNR
jgi:hypothetical protein